MSRTKPYVFIFYRGELEQVVNMILHQYYWHERVAFGRSTTGNDVVATKNDILFFFLSFFGTSVQRSSRSAFGGSTGNDVSGHYKHHYFLSFLFFFFLRSLPFL